jgi:hypothetical protein
MGTKYTPVDLAKVEQGQFKNDCDTSFLRLQKEIIAHYEKYGIPVSGKINMSIEIKAEDGVFKIISKIDEKLPTRPPDPRRITTAFVDESEGGEKCLFSADSGTSTGNPKQQKLCHDDGRNLKPEQAKSET